MSASDAEASVATMGPSCPVWGTWPTDDADEQEKQQAREVLPAVMGSDVWDEMLDEFEGARQRVARLMNNSNV